MLKVSIGNESGRLEYEISPYATLREAFTEAGVDIGVGQQSLNTKRLAPDELDKTFADHGYGDTYTAPLYLLSIFKADNN